MVSAGQNASSNPKNPGSTRYSQVWTWEEGIQNLDVVLLSESRGTESYVCFRTILDICLSETQASGNREECAKDLTPQATSISDAKAASGQGMKGGCRKGTETLVRKVHIVALMDIRPHPKVRVHPGEGSQEQSQVWTEVRVHPGECSEEQSQVLKQFCA